MRKICLAAALAFLPLGLMADGSANSSATSFMIGRGARPTAMGGAYMAVGDDAESILWNPAGLTSLRDMQLTASHLSYLMGVNDEFIAFGQPLYGMGAWGLGVSYLYSQDVYRDNWGNQGDAFTNFDFSMQVAYAVDLLPDLSVGTTYKILRQGYGNTAYSMGSAFDVGVQYRGLFSPHLTLAVTALNFGTPLSLGSNINFPPMTLDAGLAWSVTRQWLLAADYENQPLDFVNKVHLGTEYRYQTHTLSAALRAGYILGPENNLGPASGLTLGAGLGFNAITVDYSYAPYGDLGVAHRVSLTYQFGVQ